VLKRNYEDADGAAPAGTAAIVGVGKACGVAEFDEDNLFTALNRDSVTDRKLDSSF
jgi:hypothetical protein